MVGTRINLLLSLWIVVIVFPIRVLAALPGKVWFRTQIFESKFEKAILLSYVPCRSPLCASCLCKSANSCYLFCQETESSFSLWKVLASPFMNGGAVEQTKICWTAQSNRNFVPLLSGVSIQGNTVHYNHPDRVVENLIDGLYTFQSDSQYHATPQSNTFFVIDLATPVMIEKIVLYPASNAPERFRELSIRVGNNQEAGDFSSYEEVYYYLGPVPDANFVLNIDLDVPKLARFISAQISIGGNLNLHVGHVEVILTDEEYRQRFTEYEI